MAGFAQIFNYCEAALWFGMGLVFTTRWRALEHRRRGSLLLIITALILFGISDLIEAQTGAWWEPWWLLIVKVGCIATFALSIRSFRKKSRQMPPQAASMTAIDSND